MSGEALRQKLGLLALAFDAKGREILEVLVNRPDLAEAQVEAYHLDDAGEEGSPSWHWRRAAPDTPSWKAMDGDGSDDFAARLEGAVRILLDVGRGRGGGSHAVDLLDLVVVNPEAHPLEPGIVEALGEVRRRFRRVARVLLVFRGSFKPLGAGTASGVLEPLPYADGSDGGVFDLVLLMDRVNTEGLVLTESSAEAAQAAGAIVQLTIGDLAPKLHPLIQSKQAQLHGTEGRYLALGLTEWRLDRGLGAEALGTLLYQQMAALLAGEVDRAREAPQAPGNDTWPGEVTEWYEKVSEKLREMEEAEKNPQAQLRARQADTAEMEVPDSTLARFEKRGWETARTLFGESKWRLEALEELLVRRLQELTHLRDKATKDLNAFMTRFAPWYVEKMTGGKTSVDEEHYEDKIVKKSDPSKVALFATLLFLCLGSAIAAYFTNYQELYWLAGALGLGAAIRLIAGLSTTYSRPERVVIPREVDLEPRLRLSRGRKWLLDKLISRHKSALDRLRESLETLGKEGGLPFESWSFPFPFTVETCSALLKTKSVDADQCLHQIWERKEGFFEEVAGLDETTLPQRLREAAVDSCQRFSSLRWQDVLDANGGVDILKERTWVEELERARLTSLPWVPVPGVSSQTILHLPRNMPDELRTMLGGIFPDQKAIEESNGQNILALQLTQGYKI